MKGQIAGIEDSLSRIEIGQDLSQVIGGAICDINLEDTIDKNSRGEYRNDNFRNSGYNRGRERSRERSFSRNYSSNRTRSTCNSRLRSGSITSTNTG